MSSGATPTFDPDAFMASRQSGAAQPAAAAAGGFDPDSFMATRQGGQSLGKRGWRDWPDIALKYIDEKVPVLGQIDRYFVAPGYERMEKGTHEVSAGNYARGGSDIVRGFGQMTAPPFVAAGMAPVSMGGASAPVATLTGVGAGMATQQALEHGLPHFANVNPDTAALVSDIGGIATGYGVSAMPEAGWRGFWGGAVDKFPNPFGMLRSGVKGYRAATAPPPEPPREGPFRINPNVARNLRYGGPAGQEYSAPARGVAPSVRPSERAVAPSTQPSPPPPEVTPHPAGRGTRVKYGGPAETEYSAPARDVAPAVRPSERAVAPSTQETPVTPHPAGRGTGTRYGGRYEQEYGSAGRGGTRPAVRPSERGAAPGTRQPPPAAQTPPVQKEAPSPTGPRKAPKTEQQSSSPAVGGNTVTARNARALARYLRENKVNPHGQNRTAWKALADHLGMKIPERLWDDTIQQTLYEMQKGERVSFGQTSRELAR